MPIKTSKKKPAAALPSIPKEVIDLFVSGPMSAEAVNAASMAFKKALINVVSAALILSYAVAPVSVAALRRNAPDMPRPFWTGALPVLGPLSFIIAALIVYWSGWSTVSWLLSLQILMFLIYLMCYRFVPTAQVTLRQQVSSSAWLIGFYAITIILSKLGSFGGLGVLRHPFDTIAVAACALGIYYWGAATGVPTHLIQLGEDDESEAENEA